MSPDLMKSATGPAGAARLAVGAPSGAAGGDHYQTLGLPETYAIDPAELERRYLERSRAVHPDRFATAPAAERVRALQASMQLNEAYNTLRAPAARAEYLLARRGVTIGANEQLDPEFLMAVLEAREDLAEAVAAGETARLRALEDDMLDRRDQALARVAAAFARLEAGEGNDASAPILSEIKRDLILLRYVDRYLEQLDGEAEL